MVALIAGTIFSDLDFSGRQVIVNSLYIKSHMSANEGECC